MRMAGPDGKVGHAEIRVGGAMVMLADEFPDMGFRSPQSLGGSPVSLLLYVEDVDAQVRQALDAGATLLRPVEDRFYGDRSGILIDPFRHVWTLATHKEDVSPEEMARRSVGFLKKQGCA
jgi:PhnB protein